MSEKLLEALDEVSDRHITQAANQKKRKTRNLLRIAAAVLVVVMTLVLLRPEPPAVEAVELVSAAQYSPHPFPDVHAYEDREELELALDAYWAQARPRNETVEQAKESLQPFWERSFREFLTGGENAVWSPINAYMALAMLAQTTSGSTRQEILDVLGTGTIEDLQTEVKAIWEKIYRDGEGSKRLLANSVWLDDELTYRQENLEVLGTDYYASVHRTELDNSAADADIQAWIDEHTEGLLEGFKPKDDGFHPLGRRVLTLVSTAYVCDGWLESFEEADNTEDIFHAPDGDVTCTYMNGLKKLAEYGRGGDFTAVALGTNEGCDLWLILPDEGTSVEALLEQGDYLDMVLGLAETDSRKVRLSMPKFDIAATMDLSDGLKRMGIREAFSTSGGDFSETLSLGGPIYVDDVRQSARVIVDETGIRAASATIIEVLSKGPEPEPIQVTLDRPFLFVLTCWDIPLFAGVVTNP